ncbi:MAG: hypothetical protein ABSD96_22120 [Candidatus Korobacteraceae bacterium]|jgi:hypothetical protein
MTRNNVSYSNTQLVIALAVVAAIVVFVMVVPNPEAIDDKWFGLCSNTLLVFGILLYWSRDRLKQKPFWVWFASVLAVHLALYSMVLHKVRHWPLVDFGIVDLVEWAVLAAIFKRIGRGRQAE